MCAASTSDSPVGTVSRPSLLEGFVRAVRDARREYEHLFQKPVTAGFGANPVGQHRAELTTPSACVA